MKPITILMIFIGCLAGSGWASAGSSSPTPQAKTANSSASLFQSAVSAYERKNYPVALKIFTKLAEQGDAIAQSALGFMYANGEGVPKDASQAVTWYRKAAEQGLDVAQYELGLMYANGEGVPKNASQAAAWYRKAAEQGHAIAQYNLGVMYGNGEGVPKDASQAVTWYRKAAEQGNAKAQFNLGVMYANGEGVPKDYVQAAKWLYLGKANGVEADKAIRQIESMMSHQQIEQAQALATQWWQNHH